MLFVTDHIADLIGLQFADLDPRDPLMVEAATRVSGPFQPAIHRVPGKLLDSGYRGFVSTLGAESGHLVKGFTAVMESMVEYPAVSTVSFPATLESVFPPLSHPSLLEAIIDDGIGVRFSPLPTLPTLLVWASETLHGIAPC